MHRYFDARIARLRFRFRLALSFLPLSLFLLFLPALFVLLDYAPKRNAYHAALSWPVDGRRPIRRCVNPGKLNSREAGSHGGGRSIPRAGSILARRMIDQGDGERVESARFALSTPGPTSVEPRSNLGATSVQQAGLKSENSGYTIVRP